MLLSVVAGVSFMAHQELTIDERAKINKAELLRIILETFERTAKNTSGLSGSAVYGLSEIGQAGDPGPDSHIGESDRLSRSDLYTHQSLHSVGSGSPAPLSRDPSESSGSSVNHPSSSTSSKTQSKTSTSSLLRSRYRGQGGTR